MENQKKGFLIIVSGPAGSGKGTILQELFNQSSSFAYSISATTRNPRPNEQHGTHYYFITREEFENRIFQNTMLEYTEYCGNYYGTPVQEVEYHLNQGKHVILEIEVKGAMQIKQKRPDALLLLVLPPDFTTLEARLRGRKTETEEVILQRLETAKQELTFCDQYDYCIYNHDGGAKEAATAILEIVHAEQHRIQRIPNLYEEFFKES